MEGYCFSTPTLKMEGSCPLTKSSESGARMRRGMLFLFFFYCQQTAVRGFHCRPAARVKALGWIDRANCPPISVIQVMNGIKAISFNSQAICQTQKLNFSKQSDPPIFDNIYSTTTHPLKMKKLNHVDLRC